MKKVISVQLIKNIYTKILSKYICLYLYEKVIKICLETCSLVRSMTVLIDVLFIVFSLFWYLLTKFSIVIITRRTSLINVIPNSRVCLLDIYIKELTER